MNYSLQLSGRLKKDKATLPHGLEQESYFLQPHHQKQNKLPKFASKLFSVISQLRKAKNYHDLPKLRDYLFKELKLFQSLLEKLSYDEEIILISQYALSATIDDIILQTPWGTKNWGNHCLLKGYSDLTSNERFFTLLERICQDAKHYIDLIELMYICLMLGFEGKFRGNIVEKNQLQVLKDQVYQIILNERKDFEKSLSDLKLQEKHSAPLQQKQTSYRSRIGLLVLFTTILVSSIYFTLNSVGKISLVPVMNQIDQITNAIGNK